MSNVDARWWHKSREELKAELDHCRHMARILDGTKHAAWFADRAELLDDFIWRRYP